ncbi:MAG: FAD-dependent oxidoreductase [Gemmatales bacterium]|nr:MAG: FAD-dependent oxidoreductase [Gemmatales bacterium]
MNSASQYDAIVIGSGPNGLSAAIALAREGCSVLVVEAEPTIGGGTRTAELTLPGFRHDLCSAIHPLAAASPFFQQLSLEKHGLEWVQPEFPLAHPFDDGTAAVLKRDIGETSATLGVDGEAYRRLLAPLVERSADLFADALGPLRWPRHPFLMLRFGRQAIRSARGLVKSWFCQERARGLFAGLAGHAILPLEQTVSSAVGLMLAIAGHAVGWPLPKRGSQSIADALAAKLRTLGSEIVTGKRVTSLAELPPARVVLFDTIPRSMASICGERLPVKFRQRLQAFRHGPGVFKLDWALSEPIPWKAPECRMAGTVHVGGTFDEIAYAERIIWHGQHPERPYILVAQQSLFDPSRAPEGKHTGWAYCHVPHGSTVDMTERIEAQVERFAPGFRDCILARSVMAPADFARRNANYIGGDITGGIVDLWQLFTRPTWRRTPYATPAHGIFLCSSSTPPGPGVHGMCGYFAARAALAYLKSRNRQGRA